MDTFPGIGGHLDDCVADHDNPGQARGAVSGDALLSQIGDLIGQAVAYGPGEIAERIMAEAEYHVDIIKRRFHAAEAALAAGRKLIKPTKPVEKPQPHPHHK